jgi:hypothetical protein
MYRWSFNSLYRTSVEQSTSRRLKLQNSGLLKSFKSAGMELSSLGELHGKFLGNDISSGMQNMSILHMYVDHLHGLCVVWLRPGYQTSSLLYILPPAVSYNCIEVLKQCHCLNEERSKIHE